MQRREGEPVQGLHHGEGHHVGGQRHGHPAQHASDGGERHDAGRTQALHERGADQEKDDDFGGN